MVAQPDNDPRSQPRSVGTARRLLARLRDVMAGSGTVQARLDRIVRLVAAEMVAEVCSCYVMRPGDVLELFSTVGLRSEAVHRTRLSVGEGLVGEVAATGQPLALTNAPSHPKFAYRPETGEDPYNTFMGVPILRSGGVRGVLVIQNRARRDYLEEEVEALATTATVVAEMVARPESLGDTSAGADLTEESTAGTLPSRLTGTIFVPGLAQGHAILHRPQFTSRQVIAEDPIRERERLGDALEAMDRSLDRLAALTAGSGTHEGTEVLETYRLFSRDRGWVAKMQAAIDGGLTAEAAVERVLNDLRARLSHVSDAYLRERLADFEDLASRLLHHLSGRTSTADHATLPEEVILVARSIGPAELLDYDHRRLRAVVLEKGSPTAHVAIVARALGIPMIGRCERIMSVVEPLDPMIVDADHGQVFIRPSDEVQTVFAATVDARRDRAAAQAKLLDLPAVSRDGVAVSLMVNAGLLIDAAHARDVAADGIGLYRTEIPFMVRSSYPDTATQADIYAKAMDTLGDRPITFRTLDIGGDKLLPYLPHAAEDNPALGWRAARIALDRPAMLRQQIRAMLAGAAGRPIRIMAPMVTTREEARALRALFAEEVARAQAALPDRPPRAAFGIMLEVPALLWDLPRVFPLVDFIAVGSNDLAQYFFAADRGNAAVAGRYDPLSPPFLQALASLADQAGAAGVPLSVCGEMAGRPVDAVALAAFGLTCLSMPPSAILPVKAALRTADLGAVRAMLAARWDSQGLRNLLTTYLRDRGVDL